MLQVLYMPFSVLNRELPQPAPLGIGSLKTCSMCGHLYRISVSIRSSSGPKNGFWVPALNLGPSKFCARPALPTYHPSCPNHGCPLLAETGWGSSTNIHMLFVFRRIRESKLHILFVNQQLRLKEALTSRTVFWRLVSSSVFIFFYYSKILMCSHLVSDIVTVYVQICHLPLLLHPPHHSFLFVL